MDFDMHLFREFFFLKELLMSGMKVRFKLMYTYEMIFSMLLIQYKLCNAYCMRHKNLSGYLSCFQNCDDKEKDKGKKTKLNFCITKFKWNTLSSFLQHFTFFFFWSILNITQVAVLLISLCQLPNFYEPKCQASYRVYMYT